MSKRYWLISDGTVKVRRETVPAGNAYNVVLWDGETEWTPPPGATAELEETAKASGRVWWTPPKPK